MSLEAGETLRTHIVAGLQDFGEVGIHVVVIHSHEERVHDDAQGDEELHEWVEDDESEDLLHSNPAPAALPHTQDVDSPQTRTQHPLLQLHLQRLFLLLLRLLLVFLEVVH